MKRLFWVLLSLCYVSAAFASDAAAKKLMEQGKKLFDQAKYESALSTYEKALSEAPKASGPFRELGRCYQQLKRFDEAISSFTEYLKRRPDAPERDALIEVLPALREQLPKEGRALITIKAPAGTLVYVVDGAQERGLGIAPFERHPLEPNFQRLKLLAPSLPPVELPMSLTATQEQTFQINESGELVVNNPVEPPIDERKPTSLAATSTPTEKTLPNPEKKPTLAKALLGVGGAGLLVGLGANVMLNVDSNNSTQATNRISEIQVERSDPNITPEQLAALNEESTTLSDQLDKLQARNPALLIAMGSGLAVAAIAGSVGAVLLVRSKKASTAQSIQLLPTRNGAVARFSF